MKSNYRLQCHKTLSLDSSQLKAFSRHSILMWHQVGMRISARQPACSESQRVLHWVQISGAWRHHYHPQQIPSHFTVWVSQLFHGCYNISQGSGQGHQAQSATALCVSWVSHSQVGVWHEVEKPSLAVHCSSTCESSGGRQNCFLVSFHVSVLLPPLSRSTARIEIRPVLLSPNTGWHTWHKSDPCMRAEKPF